MKECLDETILQSYVDGELSNQQLESVTSHLAGCQTCALAAREIESETVLLASALASEFETAVPSEQLRRRIDAAITGLQTQRAVVNESSAFSIRSWFQSLVAPLTPQRTFGYAGLVVVLGFAAILGITQLRNKATVPVQTNVAGNSEVTPITKPNGLTPTAPAVDPGTVAVIPVSTPTRKPSNVRPRLTNSATTVASKPADNADDKVKLLPGERSYLQTIAKLDSTIKSNDRPMRPSLQAEYQRNLALVDRALAATRDVAKKNPSDPDAAEFMMAAYQNKVNLLNAVAEARTFNRQQD